MEYQQYIRVVSISFYVEQRLENQIHSTAVPETKSTLSSLLFSEFQKVSWEETFPVNSKLSYPWALVYADPKTWKIVC